MNKYNEKIIKVITAVSEDLIQLASKDLFLLDLLEIVSNFDVIIPDLKDRPDDFELLSYYFLKITLTKYSNNSKVELTEGALETMRLYSWPLNITELQMVLKKALFLSEPTQEFKNDTNSLIISKYIITEAELNLDNNFLSTDLKPLSDSFKLSDELKNLERRYINEALKSTHLDRSMLLSYLDSQEHLLFVVN